MKTRRIEIDKTSAFKKIWTLQINIQKYCSRGVIGKRCSKGMHQVYRRTPMPKCDFNKVALQRY